MHFIFGGGFPGPYSYVQCSQPASPLTTRNYPRVHHNGPNEGAVCVCGLATGSKIEWVPTGSWQCEQALKALGKDAYHSTRGR